jgi:hypothetical protein
MDWHERRGIMSFLLDKGAPEILSAAKDLWRTSGESPVLDFLTGTLDYAFEMGI